MACGARACARALRSPVLTVGVWRRRERGHPASHCESHCIPGLKQWSPVSDVEAPRLTRALGTDLARCGQVTERGGRGQAEAERGPEPLPDKLLQPFHAHAEFKPRQWRECNGTPDRADQVAPVASASRNMSLTTREARTLMWMSGTDRIQRKGGSQPGDGTLPPLPRNTHP
eukprot:1844936-Rhodomonas_salina.2